jgi:hypothetical protein
MKKEIIVVTPIEMGAGPDLSFETAMKLFAEEVLKQPKGKQFYQVVVPHYYSSHVMKQIKEAYLMAGWKKVSVIENTHEKYPGTGLELNNY